MLVDSGFGWLESPEAQDHLRMNIHLWAEAQPRNSPRLRLAAALDSLPSPLGIEEHSQVRQRYPFE